MPIKRLNTTKAGGTGTTTIKNLFSTKAGGTGTTTIKSLHTEKPSLEIQYIVVAGGGGGGGGGAGENGGGGGAGGVVTRSTILNRNTLYSIIVGAGGIGNLDQNTNGNNSSITYNNVNITPTPSNVPYGEFIVFFQGVTYAITSVKVGSVNLIGSPVNSWQYSRDTASAVVAAINAYSASSGGFTATTFIPSGWIEASGVRITAPLGSGRQYEGASVGVTTNQVWDPMLFNDPSVMLPGRDNTAVAVAFGGGTAGNQGGSGGGAINPPISKFSESGGIAYPAEQGNNGGRGYYYGVHWYSDPGGGGGAGSVGGSLPLPVGGIGIINPIIGSTIGQFSGGNYWLAGGGGGGCSSNSDGGSGGIGGGGNGALFNWNTCSALAGEGMTNTGGGGGGAGGYSDLGDCQAPSCCEFYGEAKNGGSGVVIIKYISPTQLATGGIVTNPSTNNWIHTFTTSGTFTLS